MTLYQPCMHAYLSVCNTYEMAIAERKHCTSLTHISGPISYYNLSLGPLQVPLFFCDTDEKVVISKEPHLANTFSHS